MYVSRNWKKARDCLKAPTKERICLGHSKTKVLHYYQVSTGIPTLVKRRSPMSKTIIHHVVGIDSTTLIVFYTEVHNWQFRLISFGGAVFGGRKIYYSAEAALKAGLEWNGTKLTKSISSKTLLTQNLTGFHH